MTHYQRQVFRLTYESKYTQALLDIAYEFRDDENTCEQNCEQCSINGFICDTLINLVNWDADENNRYTATPIKQVTEDDAWRMLFGLDWKTIKRDYSEIGTIMTCIHKLCSGESFVVKFDVEHEDIVIDTPNEWWFSVKLDDFVEYYELRCK